VLLSKHIATQEAPLRMNTNRHCERLAKMHQTEWMNGKLLALILTLAVLLFDSCVTENQTYLIACPADNMSTMYPVCTVRQGWVQHVGTLEILFDDRQQPAMLLNSCEWIFVGDEMLDAPHQVVEAYGDNIWWYGQKLRQLR